MTTTRPKILNFITSNPNKLLEVRSILSPTGVTLTSTSLDITEIQGSTTEIALDKSRRAAELTSSAVLTEDTSLEFHALGNLPGPYIKYFLEALGHSGLNKLLAAYEDKSATAVCTFAYCAGPGQEPVLFQGKCEGRIVPARGPGTFGWDAIFEFNGEGETYAEMEKEKKGFDPTYAQGKALAKLKAWLAGEDVESQRMNPPSPK